MYETLLMHKRGNDAKRRD